MVQLGVQTAKPAHRAAFQPRQQAAKSRAQGIDERSNRAAKEQREEEAKAKNEQIDTAVESESAIGKEKTPEEIAQERAKLTE